MGIDIIFIVESYDEVTGKWNLVEWNDQQKQYVNTKVDEEPEQAPGDSDEQYEQLLEDWRDTFPINSLTRCYKLFALLSGMCNQYDIIPYSPAKGIPDNLSPASMIILDVNVEEEIRDRECSWLSGKELLDIYENDVLRSNSVLHGEYKKGILDEFTALVSQFGEFHESYRIIFWYG